VWLNPSDEHLCNDCGTCYQELPQFFRKKTEVVDGEARILAEFIPGSTDGVEISAELAKRIERVKNTCDAEIIR
jgi:pyruvate-ferredoxin/flavodoxin oxidoreductase